MITMLLKWHFLQRGSTLSVYNVFSNSSAVSEKCIDIPVAVNLESQLQFTYKIPKTLIRVLGYLAP